MGKRHNEGHRIEAIGWLRAAVLGANDGIVSTASLILGVASASAGQDNILLTGVAGLVAGAMSMATGEYVSVSSQADTEKAALEEEKIELAENYSGEHAELTAIYVRRGLPHALASEVADKLMTQDAIGAHARDEFGITAATAARPLQAAFYSAVSFAIGAALPLGVAAIAPSALIIPFVSVAALISLAILGGLASKTGGARILPGVVRVMFWSALAMGVTSAIGALFGAVG